MINVNNYLTLTKYSTEDQGAKDICMVNIKFNINNKEWVLLWKVLYRSPNPDTYIV